MIHFVWRACKASLGVQERLFFRHIPESPSCSICGANQEAICHALFDCTQAHAIWQVSNFSSLIADVPRTSFLESFVYMVNKVSKDELSVVCAILWAAWFCRNKIIFESQTLCGVEVASNFVKMVLDYGSYTENVFRPVPPVASSSTKWNPPAAGLLKVNFDAHVRENGEIGLGVVMRNCDGEVKLLATKRIGARWDATLAEAMAARFAVEVSLRLGYDKVIFEGDALSVVNAVKNNVEGVAPLFRVFDDIRSLARNFICFSFLHVKRAGNVVAHLLARWDCPCNSEIVWLDAFPESISTLVDIDLI